VIPIIGAVGMTGKIVVQPAGSKLPKAPELVTAAAGAAISTDIAAAQAADAAARKVASRPGANGATIYTVPIGGATASGGELVRFGSSDLTIKVGDATYANPAATVPVGGIAADTTESVPTMPASSIRALLSRDLAGTFPQRFSKPRRF
jgi:hypothetical protein